MSSSSIKEKNKAIRKAWEREQLLVSEGKGTRDWTKEQQQDILNPDKGKAYDEKGRAFNGQHMKSVAKYPEYQGDPDNIQFLTRDEHLEAHKGSWQNPTNWYYDPTTKQFFDFGEGGLIPCKIIELNNPIITTGNGGVDVVDDVTKQERKEQSFGAAPSIMSSQQLAVTPHSISKSAPKLSAKQVSKGTMFHGLKSVANGVKDFSDKHPVLKMVVEVGLGLTVATVAGKAIDTRIKSKPSGTGGHRLLNNQTLKAAAETVIDAVSKFDFKKSESDFKQLGYSVAKNIGLSDGDRQKILREIIVNGKMSKDAVCAFLENNINLHKNQNTFTDAVGKWIADLTYIKDAL